MNALSPVAIVGAGAVGTALARGLAKAGVPVGAVVSRNPTSARNLADDVGAPVSGRDLAVLPDETRVVFLCVPDDAISDVATALAEEPRSWGHTVVAHTSGAKAADVLAPVAKNGAAILSFHPLQTFAADRGPDAFEDVVIAVEGDDEAVSAGTSLAQALGARPVVLTAQQKALYHCAAALASNGLVALMAVVEELFAAAGVDDAEAPTTDLVAPLVEQTWSNLTSSGPEGALTGPVARGDETTVEAHLQALEGDAPHLIPLYAALSTEMVRTAVRGGQLDDGAAESLVKLLQTAMKGYSEGTGPPGDCR